MFRSNVNSLLLVVFLILAALPLSCTEGSISLPEKRGRSGGTIVVNATGSGDYERIQEAIDDADEGDAVFIEAGYYNEKIIIDKPISLVGSDKNDTIIYGRGEWDVIITIRSNWVNVSGFKINNKRDNYEKGAGITLEKSNYCEIWNNNCSENTDGILLSDSNNNSVSDNILRFNDRGIILSNSKGNVITNNNVTQNDEGIFISLSNNNRISNNTCINNNKYGICLDDSRHITMEKNEMLDGGLLMDGGTIDIWNTHSIDSSNTVNGKSVCYFKNVTDGMVPRGIGQVILANCTNVTINGLNLSNTTMAITSAFSNGINIHNNTCLENSFSGIYLYSSENNSIKYNNCFNNSEGIEITESNNNIIANNYLHRNEDGMAIFFSYKNTVKKNNFKQCWNGISLFESHLNLIRYNTYNNNGNGIWPWYSNNNSIENNMFNNNLIGVSSLNSDDNSITNNNFDSHTHSGINLDESRYVRISNNIMTGSGIVFSGEEIGHWNTHNISETNVLDGKPIHYLKNMNGGKAPTVGGQLILANCVNMIVSDQNFSNYDFGLTLGFSKNNTISNNRGYIEIIKSENNIIEKNNVSWTKGINIISSQLNRILGNTVHNCTELSLYRSDNNLIMNNKLIKNKDGISLYYSKNNTISNNTCDSNNRGIFLYISDDNIVSKNRCSANQRNGIEINTYSTGNVINDNSVMFNIEYGLSIEDASNHIVSNNSCISNNGTGIYIQECDSIIVEKNVCSGNRLSGISVQNSEWCRISKNACSFNNGSGIHVFISDNSSFSKNIVNNNDNGIGLWASSDNIIENNIFESNKEDGIQVYWRPGRNTIRNNTCHSNRYGINITESSMNVIYENLMIHNRNPGGQALDNGSSNTWSFSNRGNYWSDWTSPDVDSNGVVDKPYMISGTSNSRDLYPLIHPTYCPFLVAISGSDITIHKNGKVQFNGSHSIDDKGITNYTWTFTYNDEEVFLYGPTPEFNFGRKGKYTVELTVTDEEGNAASDNMTVTVEEPEKIDGDIVTVALAIVLGIVIILLLVGKIRKKKKKMKVDPKEKEDGK